MPSLRGFSARIESNGCPLPEYLVSVDEKTSRVSCWVPGIEGQVCGIVRKDSAFIDFLKAFEVHWSDDGSKISTCAFIVLDGTVVPGRFLHGEGTAFRRGVRVSRQTERPFVFQKIKGNGQ